MDSTLFLELALASSAVLLGGVDELAADPASLLSRPARGEGSLPTLPVSGLGDSVLTSDLTGSDLTASGLADAGLADSGLAESDLTASVFPVSDLLGPEDLGPSP